MPNGVITPIKKKKNYKDWAIIQKCLAQDLAYSRSSIAITIFIINPIAYWFITIPSADLSLNHLIEIFISPGTLQFWSIPLLSLFRKCFCWLFERILVFREQLVLLVLSFHSDTPTRCSLGFFSSLGRHWASSFEIFGFCSKRKNKKYSFGELYFFLSYKTRGNS